MENGTDSFSDVRRLLRTERPNHPNYCVYPHVYRETATEFLQGFPVRAYRNGEPIEGETISFQVNGTSFDSTDTLPGLVPLPKDIAAGDILEFGNIGAYSIGGRTVYNGFYSDRIVKITSMSERPPAVQDEQSPNEQETRT